MKRKFIIILVLIWSAIVSNAADTYSTFQTTRYYSENGRFFVEVEPDKTATLYRQEKEPSKIWKWKVPELPAQLFVSNDASRIISVDFYYGNLSETKSEVVIIFDEKGQKLAGFRLEEVANMRQALKTTSSTHWLWGAMFDKNQQNLIVETQIRTCDLPSSIKTEEELKAVMKCQESQPFEELVFSLEKGTLISKTNTQNKYADKETRLLRDLELSEKASPKYNSGIVYSLQALAQFFHDNKNYQQANQYFEKAIELETQTTGADEFTALIIAEFAANLRDSKDYKNAEIQYKKALELIVGKKTDPRQIMPLAIQIYEEYAEMLRELKRIDEAKLMELKAKSLREVNPNYNDSR